MFLESLIPVYQTHTISTHFYVATDQPLPLIGCWKVTVLVNSGLKPSCLLTTQTFLFHYRNLSPLSLSTNFTHFFFFFEKNFYFPIFFWIYFRNFHFIWSMRKSSCKGVVGNVCKEEIDWELRPGGMLVQKRNAGDAASSPMIKIKVSHGSYHHYITIPAQSTFGNHHILYVFLILFCFLCVFASFGFCIRRGGVA